MVGLLQVTASVWLAAVETLRNFALIKSARLHMLKEGWLTQCSVLLASIHESERAKEQPAAVALVEFLANFTFAADGQVIRMSAILRDERALLLTQVVVYVPLRCRLAA